MGQIIKSSYVPLFLQIMQLVLEVNTGYKKTELIRLVRFSNSFKLFGFRSEIFEDCCR